jgi:hypothetical protein
VTDFEKSLSHLVLTQLRAEVGKLSLDGAFQAGWLAGWLAAPLSPRLALVDYLLSRG